MCHDFIESILKAIQENVLFITVEGWFSFQFIIDKITHFIEEIESEKLIRNVDFNPDTAEAISKTVDFHMNELTDISPGQAPAYIAHQVKADWTQRLSVKTLLELRRKMEKT